MTWWSAVGGGNAIAAAANQDNTIVRALRTIRRSLFYLDPIYRNTNLISKTTELQEFSKFTKNAPSAVLQHRPTHTA